MSSWIAVACAEHVAKGVAGAFMQVCHGKSAPLRRLQTGDTVIYYSGADTMGGSAKCQQFTAIGSVLPGDPYRVEVTSCFMPYRRNVDWRSARPAPIRPLLADLSFTAGRRNWGYVLRYGIIKIADTDARVIADAMAAGIAKPEPVSQASFIALLDN